MTNLFLTEVCATCYNYSTNGEYQEATSTDRDIRRLPDSELELMQIIWDLEPPLTRQDIEAHLPPDRPLAPTTVLTFLDRLREKGFLRSEKQGKANCYTPLVTRREYLARESRGVLDRLFGGSVSAFATALVDGGVSREEIDRLRRLLEEGDL